MSLLLSMDDRSIRIEFESINPACADGFLTRGKSSSFKHVVFLQAGNFVFYSCMPNRSIWSSNCLSIGVRCSRGIKMLNARETGWVSVSSKKMLSDDVHQKNKILYGNKGNKVTKSHIRCIPSPMSRL